MYDAEYIHSLYFEDIIDFSKEVCQTETVSYQERPLFSFMMCVYNDTSLLNSAINSLLKQEFKSWELVILDNSDKNENAWAMIQNAMKADSRIKGIRSTQNVGWAKGASICMQYIQGEYTTFLSADDCLNLGALEKLNEIVMEENPDVIFVGNGYVTYDGDDTINLYNKCLPDYKVYAEDNRSKTIFEIRKNVYYNSMFHYTRVSFLKENQIDFYKPYYADCASMTRVMALADKIVTSDYLVYFLTMNTSQSAGYYSLDCYQYIFASQWKSIREVFIKDNYIDKKSITFIAKGILKNLIGCIGALCTARCKNDYMNSVDISFSDIIIELEKILLNEEVLEMFVISGEKEFEKLLQNIARLRMFYNEETKAVIEQSWLRGLLIPALFRGRHWLTSGERLEYLCDFLLQEQNSHCIGIDYFIKTADECSDLEITNFNVKISMVIKKYDSFVNQLNDSWMSRLSVYDAEYIHSLYFENNIDFSKETCQNELASFSGPPVFSFMMCVYNDVSLLNSAINSLLKQQFTSWELVILDNSDKNDDAWIMIQNAMKMDSRIKGIRSTQNVGWAKGASVCMQYIRGEYTTFLSADDCINMGALERLNDVIEKENPDVIFVGNGYVSYDGAEKINFYSECIPDYNVYAGKKRSETIVEIMKKVYFNSMFHYSKVSFLKENQIDFFKPYYADCASMTRVMALADKIVTLNYLVYFLTTNTSQSAGNYAWDCYEYIFVNQWKSVKEIFQREDFKEKTKVTFVAERILKNLTGYIGNLCRANCRNEYMNPISVSFEEILQQLEDLLCTEEIIEMFLISGEKEFEKLLDGISNLKKFYNEETKAIIEDSWLKGLILLSFSQGRSKVSSGEKMEYICEFILRKENSFCLGIDYFIRAADECSGAELARLKEQMSLVTKKYDAYIAEGNGLLKE